MHQVKVDNVECVGEEIILLVLCEFSDLTCHMKAKKNWLIQLYIPRE